MFKEELDRIFISQNKALELTKYINDNIFLEEFLEYTKPSFIRAKVTEDICADDEKMIFMAFTFIALKDYNGQLWEHIYKYYESNEISRNDIYNKIRVHVFSKWVKGYHCVSNGREQTSQIPVIESVIPFNYASKYIDFVFDIYEKCFEYTLENVDEELDLFFYAIRGLLEKSDENCDEFENKSIDGSTKTYSLIRGTKKILKYPNLANKVKQLKEFTKEFLIRIDNYYTGKKNIDQNYYFDKAFEQWKNEHPEKRIERGRGTREIYLHNRRSKFIFDTKTGVVSLRTPMLHISKKEDPSQIRVVVYENGREICRKPLYIKDMISLFEICYTEVKIDNPLNNINCKVIYEEEVLYDDETGLYRSNLFFDGEKEIKPSSSFVGDLWVIYHTSNEVKLLKQMANYCVGLISITEEKYSFNVDRNYYSFNGAYVSAIDGEECKQVVLQQNSNSLKVYKSVSYLVLVSKNRSVKGNYIKVNDDNLSPSFYSVKEQKSNIAYVVHIKEVLKENGFYHIKLIDKSNQHIVDEFAFLLDKEIKVEESVVDGEVVNCIFSSSYPITDKDGVEIVQYQNNINYFERECFTMCFKDKTFQLYFLLGIPYFSFDDNDEKVFDINCSKNDIRHFSRLNFYNLKDRAILLIGENKINVPVESRDHIKSINLIYLNNYPDIPKIEILFWDQFDIEKRITIYNKPVLDLDQSIFFLDTINQKLSICPFIYGKDMVSDLKIEAETKNGMHLDIIDLDSDKYLIELGEEKQNVTIKIGYQEFDFNRFDWTYHCIYQEDFQYTPVESLMNNLLHVKCVLCDSNENPCNLPSFFIRLDERLNNEEYLATSYLAPSEEWDSGLGELHVKVESTYVAETNGRNRINLSLIYQDNDFLYYDYGRITKNSNGEKIDIFILEGDGHLW